MEKYIITINAETAEELKQAILDLAKTFDLGEVITSVKVDAEDTEPIEVVTKNVKKETPKEEPVVSPTEETFKDVAKTITLSDARKALAQAAKGNPGIKDRVSEILTNYGLEKVSQAEGNQEAILDLMALAESVKND